MILEITGFIKGDAARQSWAASTNNDINITDI